MSDNSDKTLGQEGASDTFSAQMKTAAENIHYAKEQLLLRARDHLSEPLAAKLSEPNPLGPPYTHFTGDPPQVVSIKKLINTLHYAEEAIHDEAWKEIDFSSKTSMIKTAAQSPALRQTIKNTYHAWQNLQEIAPEAIELLDANQDLLQPVFNSIYSTASSLGVSDKFTDTATVNESGEFLGKKLNALKKDNNNTLQGKLASEALLQLPGLLNQISTQLSEKDESLKTSVEISEKHQKALADMADVLFSDSSLISALPVAGRALKGFNEIYSNVMREGNNISAKTIESYLEWGQDGFSSLAIAADEFERRNYLKQGSISEPIVLQASQLRTTLEKRIAATKAAMQTDKYLPDIDTRALFNQEQLENIPGLITQDRISAVNKSKIKIQSEHNSYENQKEKAVEFFNILERYQGRDLLTIPWEDRQALKQLYPDIQIAMATRNYALDAVILDSLNSSVKTADTGIKAEFWRTVRRFIDADIKSAVYGETTGVQSVLYGEVNAIRGLGPDLIKYYDDKIASAQLKMEVAKQSEVNIRNKFEGKIAPFHSKNRIHFENKEAAQIELDGVLKSEAFIEELSGLLPNNLEADSENSTALKQKYLSIQRIIARVDPNLDKEFVTALNSGKTESLNEVFIRISGEEFQQKLQDYKSTVTQMITTEISAHSPKDEPIEPVKLSSLNTLQGRIAAIQEMHLSAQIEKLQIYSKNQRQLLLSEHVNGSLGEPPHTEAPNDPKIVKQIKQVENGLYHLQKSLNAFENIHYESSLPSKINNLYNLGQSMNSLYQTYNQLSPEIKAQYPLLKDNLLSLNASLNQLQSQSYNAELLKEYKSPIQLGIDALYAATPFLEQKQQNLDSRFNLQENQQNISGFTREQLKDPNFMRKEADKITAGLEKFVAQSELRGLFHARKILNQLERLGQQAGEIGGSVHQVATTKSSEIKKELYQNLLPEISRLEDQYYLKPGSATEPAIDRINTFFDSMIRELEMPLEEKLKVMEQEYYVDLLHNEALNRREQLLEDLQQATSEEARTDINFKIKIMDSKLSYLADLGKRLEQDVQARKEKLIETELNKLLTEKYLPVAQAQLDDPFKAQYISDLKLHAHKKGTELLHGASLSQIEKDLDAFQKTQIAKYQLVDKLINVMDAHISKIAPGSNESLGKWGQKVSDRLKDPMIPIETRYSDAVRIQNDSILKCFAGKSTPGRGLFYAIKNLLHGIKYAITSSIEHKINMKEAYREYVNKQKEMKMEVHYQQWQQEDSNAHLDSQPKANQEPSFPLWEGIADTEKPNVSFQDAVKEQTPESSPSMEAFPSNADDLSEEKTPENIADSSAGFR